MSSAKKTKGGQSRETYKNVPDFLTRKVLNMGSTQKLIGSNACDILDVIKKFSNKAESIRMMRDIFRIANMKEDDIYDEDTIFYEEFIKGMGINSVLGECVIYYAICSVNKYIWSSPELVVSHMGTSAHTRPYMTYHFINFISLFMLCVKFQCTRKLCFISI